MKKHLILPILAAGLTLTSCEDFLKENPTGWLTTSSSVSTQEIACACADGAYSNITTWNNGGGGWGGNNASLLEFMTGKADGNSPKEAFKFYNLEYDARAFYIDNWWSGLYSGVARANLAIQKIGEINTLPAATKTNMI